MSSDLISLKKGLVSLASNCIMEDIIKFMELDIYVLF